VKVSIHLDRRPSSLLVRWLPKMNASRASVGGMADNMDSLLVDNIGYRTLRTGAGAKDRPA
jgi:hypothetical protein